MFIIRDFAVAVAVGTILLLLLSKLIGRVQFSLATAFWCSFIGHMFVTILGLILGFVFASYLGIGLLLALVVGCLFQTVLFQIAVRAKGGTLAPFRAFVLSLIVVLGDIFVASPLIEFRWQILNYVASGAKNHMLITILAVVGWLLFVATAVLYRVGNRINARQEAALSWFALALAMSDNFRNGTKQGYERAVREWRETGIDSNKIEWGLFQTVTQTANDRYREDSDLFTVGIAVDAIKGIE